MTYYHGNDSGQIPGILPGPPPEGDYYWWEGGALWGAMIDYWHYTGDTTYNGETEYALVFQAGAPQNSYMPPNWTASLGNDDQGFWAMSALLAAETNFQNPVPTDPQWLALAQAVFNTQAPRWDNASCGGGIRWQIPFANNGYNYKNTIANAVFFNLGARLARYTGNETYAQYASMAYDWLAGVGYIDHEYNCYDGGHVELNCTDVNKAQFSYNPAVLIQGCGFMYNFTNGSPLWAGRITGLTNRTFEYFFPKGVAVETPCELADKIQCNTDQLSFKCYLHRFLAQTTQVAPFIRDTIMPVLRTSAAGAVAACESDGTCGFRWTTGSYDGLTGAGQQMGVLGALLSLLVDAEAVPSPYTNSSGGTSVGNPAAGSNPPFLQPLAALTTRDRAGAGVLTALIIIAMVSTLLWMSTGAGERGVPQPRPSEKGKSRA